MLTMKRNEGLESGSLHVLMFVQAMNHSGLWHDGLSYSMNYRLDKQSEGKTTCNRYLAITAYFVNNFSIGEALSVGTAMFLIFYVIFTIYAFVSHFIGKHQRCGRNAVLIAAMLVPSFFAAGLLHPPHLTPIIQPIQTVYLLTVIISALLLPFTILYAKNTKEYKALVNHEMGYDQPKQLSESIQATQLTVSWKRNQVPASEDRYGSDMTFPRQDGGEIRKSPWSELPESPTRLSSKQTLSTESPMRATSFPATPISAPLHVRVSGIGTNFQPANNPSLKQFRTSHLTTTQESPTDVNSSEMPKVSKIIKNRYYSMEISRLVSRIMHKGFRYRGKTYQQNRFFLRVQDIDVVWRINEQGRVPPLTKRQLSRLKKLGILKTKLKRKSRVSRPVPTEKCWAVKHAITLAALEIIDKEKKRRRRSGEESS